MNFLVDTNVISELRKKKKSNPRVLDWFASLSDETIFLSALTIGELRRGVERIRARDTKQASSLDSWLRLLVESFSERILPIDRSVAEEWGRLPSRDSLSLIDALIGATARVHGLTVATRNVKDISRTGALCFNPFEAEQKQ